MQKLTLEDVISCFDLTAEQACHELDVSTTTMKKFCRSHNIQRWPYRKVEALKKEIETIKIELETKMLTEREKKKRMLRLKDRQWRLRKIKNPETYREAKERTKKKAQKNGNSFPQYPPNRYSNRPRRNFEDEGFEDELGSRNTYFPSPGNNFKAPIPLDGGNVQGKDQRNQNVAQNMFSKRYSGPMNNQMSAPAPVMNHMPYHLQGIPNSYPMNQGTNAQRRMYPQYGFGQSGPIKQNFLLNGSGNKVNPFINHHQQIARFSQPRQLNAIPTHKNLRGVNFGQMNRSQPNIPIIKRMHPRFSGGRNIQNMNNRPQNNNRMLKSFKDLLKDVQYIESQPNQNMNVHNQELRM